jgi:WD40 repeat protein
VAFSPDGRRLASASNDKIVYLWDAETGVHQQTLEGHTDWVLSVAFSSDGRRLVSVSNDMTVRLWDAETGAQQQTLKGFRIPAYYQCSVAFSSDSSYIITGLGSFALNQSSPLAEITNWLSYYLQSKSWISWNGKRVLWLPPEYRPSSCCFLKNHVIAMGCTSGHVLLIQFEPSISPVST